MSGKNDGRVKVFEEGDKWQSGTCLPYQEIGMLWILSMKTALPVS